MALFGSKEKATVNRVRPTVVRTHNVAKEIFNFSKTYDIKPEMLDFNILEVQTYTKTDEKDAEWELFSEESLSKIDKKKTFLNEHFQIKQTYEIEIFSRVKDDESPLKDMKLAVGANATKCKVYLSIAAGSKVSYVPSLEQELLIEINKRKIRAGILIHIFDEMLKESISKISAFIRVREIVSYEKSQTHLIAEGIEPTPTTDDALLLHYETHKSVDESQKVDYSSRGFIQNVKKDELLIEYIKPRKGSSGRNCRGEYMQPQEPRISQEISFTTDETIKQVESEESIQYIAKMNGYIALVEGVYTIKKDMGVGEISFKTTGSIASGIDSDVNLVVTETNAVKDAVGSGMIVEVTEIEVDGNVGPNAKVTAIRASIGGQTHSSALLNAEKLDINVHKGKAFGDSIHITRLEHGEATGESVDVAQALGGKLNAKEITIGVCGSHVKATASKSIEIKKLQGSENIFTIDPLVVEGSKEKLKDNQESIKTLERELKELKRELDKYTKMIKEGKVAFGDLKKRLLHYKKSGVKMPESFVKKYKQFQRMQEHLQELEKNCTIKEEHLKVHSLKRVSLQDNILEAKIINRDRWVGYNEIRFRLVDPEMELVYKPQEGSKERYFSLVEVDEGEFVIQALETPKSE